ncbi:hypothetical protein PHYC_03049 [Phycisphaerales bacterium]|nr:hypothetical protein PHYC_03049 [Phycisphaerales bacterium]
MDSRRTFQGVSWFGKVQRPYEVVVGGAYVVQPLDPSRRENRGRVCTVVGVELGRALVMFHDTDERALVDFEDLVGDTGGRSGDPGMRAA